MIEHDLQHGNNANDNSYKIMDTFCSRVAYTN